MSWSSASHRWAGAVIVTNGLFNLVGILVRGPFVPPSGPDPGAFSRWAATDTLVPAYLVVIVGTACGTFGYLALWPAIGTRLAAWGAVLAALGYQFLLALFGILISFHAFAAAGPQAGTAAAAAAFSGPAGATLQALSGLNFVGSILLAIALWRAGSSARWSAPPLASAPFLLAFPVTLISEVLGAVLLMLAGALIALRLERRQLAAGMPVAGFDVETSGVRPS